MKHPYPKPEEGLIGQIEQLQECPEEQLKQFLQATIRIFSRPEDTQPEAMEPVHGFRDPPKVVRVSFRRTDMPHDWGNDDNPITQALRAWDEGDHGPMERVNQILFARLGVKIEPIATANPLVGPEEPILSNMVVTGVHGAVQSTLDVRGGDSK